MARGRVTRLLLPAVLIAASAVLLFGGAGAGAIVAIAMLVAPAIVKACSEGLALIRSD